MGAGLSLTADIRKFFAFLSACGLIASIVAYVDTFSVVRMDFIFRLWIILIVGWMFLLALIYFLEYPACQTSSFLWKGFTRGMPSWVGPCIGLLWLIAISHAIWFSLHSSWGVPTIQDGQYAIGASGQILRVLTREEYIKLRSAEARMLAAATASFYFVPMTYWWFRRN